MRLRASFSLVAAAAALAGPTAAHASPAADSMFVSAAWVAAHLNDPKLVVLHVVGRATDYEAGHVPGARMILFSQIAGPHNGLSTELHPVPQLDSALEAAGVSNDSRIIIYGGPVPAARMYMTLDYLGLASRVSVMNGGIAAWKSNGGDVSTETPRVTRGVIRPNLQSVVVEAPYVAANLSSSKVTILDARDPEFYNATHAMDTMPRTGHIASALNIPYTTLTDSTGMFKDKATLAELFRVAGVKPGTQVVTYCHIGMQGSVLYLAARSLGYDARLYDGSYEDWRRKPELPIVGPRK
ncbi:MAG: sulfurtransferase [Gemmatimonadaceae bacterium]